MEKGGLKFRARIYMWCKDVYILGITLGVLCVLGGILLLMDVDVHSEVLVFALILFAAGMLCFVPSLFTVNPNPEVMRIANDWMMEEAQEKARKIAEIEREKRKNRKQAIEQKREQEQKALAYAFGLEKICVMDVPDAAADTAKAEKYEQGLKAMRELNMMVFMSTKQEKERDWATWGGLADGIAGPGAGIMTALDIMRENDQIRARNAANLQAAAQQYVKMSDQERRLAEKRPRARQAVTLEEVEREYVASFAWSPMELLNMLSPRETMEIDELTKSVTVTVQWSRTKAKPNIDGAIRAKLYTDEGQYAGCAYLVLPKTGTTEKKGTVTGICATPVPSANYTVKLEPVNLWELEIKKNFKPREEGGITQIEHQKIVEQIEADFQAEAAAS